MQNHKNLTEGNVWRVLLSFMVPYLIANLIQALYGAVDLMVIGRYCTPESVAAVSTGTQVTQIITSVITGLTLGGTIIVGKYIGMKDEDGARTAIGTILTVFALFSLVLTGIMFLCMDVILKALHTPLEAYELAREYVRICFAGIFFICGYNAISAILRGYGDSTRPMVIIAGSCVLNMAGDLLLVKYAHLGVKGVALATIASQGISLIAAVLYLNSHDFLFQFRLKNFRIKKTQLTELMRVGIPISLQEMMVRLSFLYLTSVTNSLGVYAAAAVGIAAKYDVFAMLPAASAGSALAAVTAQNYGAGRMKRAKTSVIAGMTFAFAASLVFWLWAQISPGSMIGIFAEDERIIRAGIPFFRACSFDYLATVFVFTLNGYLNGRMKTLFTMVSVCFGALLLRIPLIFLAYRYCAENLTVLGSIAPAVSGIMAVYTLVYVLRLFRQDKTMEEENSGGEREWIS